MASLRPNLYSPGIYDPVVQSPPKIDMYVRGIINPRVSAKYRHRQKHQIDRNPTIDRIKGPLQGPLMTPSAMQMMGSGKNKSKVRAPYAKGNASKVLAFYNEAGISSKRTPKVLKGTVGKSGSTTIAREPSFNKKINRYVK
jgi:hypothetical protein